MAPPTPHDVHAAHDEAMGFESDDNPCAWCGEPAPKDKSTCYQCQAAFQLAQRSWAGPPWWTEPQKLRLLFHDLLSDCETANECREVVAHVLDKPWAWTPEYHEARERKEARQ